MLGAHDDELIGHLARAWAVRHGREISAIMGDVGRFEWPEDDDLNEREALIRFICRMIVIVPRSSGRSGP